MTIKKLIFILLIMLSFSAKETKAQITDTLAYLQTIVANKATYIGQPFSVLLDSLQIQIKFFSPNTDIYNGISKETSTGFSFQFSATENDMYLTYPYLKVRWTLHLDAMQSGILYNQNNGGGWSSAVANFYATGIIADIQIRE